MEEDFVVTELLFKGNICLTSEKLEWLGVNNSGLCLNITNSVGQGICLLAFHLSKDINNIILKNPLKI